MNKEILNKQYIILDSTAKTKSEALEELSKLGLKFKIVESEKVLLDGFLKRESEFSTGMEDGFAIPHAKIKEIKKPAIFVVKYKNELDWKTLDNSKVNFVIALLIPDEINDVHLNLLSSISYKLLNKDIKTKLKQSDNKDEIVQLLTQTDDNILNNSSDKNNENYLIAVTGCPAGVAHTYMSAKKIEQYATKMGWAVKVEKQGANGFEDKLTSKDVKQANALLIAADINPGEMERFKDVPQIRTSVAEPLHNMDKIWNDLVKISRLTNKVTEIADQSKENINQKRFSFKTAFRRQTTGLKNAVLTGISFVVPIIVAGTTISAIVTIISQIAGVDNIANHANWLNTLSSVAGGALSILLAPVLAGYIAYAMADKPGLFPGFLGGLACNAVSYSKLVDGESTTIVAGLGFLGGLVTGIMVGYMMIAAKKWIKSKKFQGILTWFVYPVFGSLIVMCIILFVIGHPLALLISLIFDGLSNLQKTNASFSVGLIIGILCVVDLGGPFNKVAWAFSFASFSSAFGENGQLINAQLLTPYTAFWAAGIGTGWTTSLVALIGRKMCSVEEKDAGKISWIMSSLGITEGSIPMMLADPFRVIPSFMVGGAVSGALSSAFNLGSIITGGGFITVAGIQSTSLLPLWGAIITFLIIAIIGCAISTILILSLKWLHTNPEKEAKTGKVALQILTFGLINIKYKNKLNKDETIK